MFLLQQWTLPSNNQSETWWKWWFFLGSDGREWWKRRCLLNKVFFLFTKLLHKGIHGITKGKPWWQGVWIQQALDNRWTKRNVTKQFFELFKATLFMFPLVGAFERTHKHMAKSNQVLRVVFTRGRAKICFFCAEFQLFEIFLARWNFPSLKPVNWWLEDEDFLWGMAPCYCQGGYLPIVTWGMKKQLVV